MTHWPGGETDRCLQVCQTGLPDGQQEAPCAESPSINLGSQHNHEAFCSIESICCCSCRHALFLLVRRNCQGMLYACDRLSVNQGTLRHELPYQSSHHQIHAALRTGDSLKAAQIQQNWATLTLPEKMVNATQMAASHTSTRTRCSSSVSHGLRRRAVLRKAAIQQI